MEIFTNPWIYLSIFLLSLGFIFYYKKQKQNKIEAQFIVTTGCLMIIFYSVCFLSGICTILNFLWKWIL